jgi:hypothetical protein
MSPTAHRRNPRSSKHHLDSRGSVTKLNEHRRLIGLRSSAFDLLRRLASMGERGGGIRCHRRDDPIVRAVDQIVQIAGRDGPEYG